MTSKKMITNEPITPLILRDLKEQYEKAKGVKKAQLKWLIEQAEKKLKQEEEGA